MSIVGRIDRDIGVGVITISDTRNEETDKGGRLVIDQLMSLNTVIDDYRIVKDDAAAISEAVRHQLRCGVDAIITTGGTGIAYRDVTIEALRPLFDKEIEGFGELFRMLSYTEDIGSRSMLSRAVAGTIGQTVIFALPGSTGAVRLGMERLIKPELNHFVHELNK
ncbi:molybdenum cofactor biosynthesis protein B [Salinicoccus sesuvii]|uniref:Molybdenum cofactor biosynthesis protein B n=1 Tax=Salinicoccus sesuvii TaxID=868281 RepID=A0ABV7N785_9STAP